MPFAAYSKIPSTEQTLPVADFADADVPAFRNRANFLAEFLSQLRTEE